MKKIQQGFSLIEVLIVVAVILLLSAISVPNLLRYLHRRVYSDLATVKPMAPNLFVQPINRRNTSPDGFRAFEYWVQNTNAIKLFRIETS